MHFLFLTQSWPVMSWSARNLELTPSAIGFPWVRLWNNSQISLVHWKNNSFPCSCYRDTGIQLYLRPWVIHMYSMCLHHCSRLKEKLTWDVLNLVSRREKWEQPSQATQHILTWLITVAHFKTTQIPLAKASHMARLAFLEWRESPMVEGQEDKYLYTNSSYYNYIL